VTATEFEAVNYQGTINVADEAFVFPGAMYGPSPFVQRAIHPTLFTGSLLVALRGELKRGVRP
jgi:hypothetical protein